MMHRLKFLLPFTMLFGACRHDQAADVQAVLPGQYSRYHELDNAKVTETLHIGRADGPLNEFPVVQYVKVEQRRKGKWVPREESRQLTARYNPASKELYLVQRGKTYRVNLQKQLIMDASDTLRKVGSLKR
ncbi:hypothetical protein [Chitinophaga sp. YIM B06452]|uniref:hypothetical protein n=1 Tax=Chitinophaga sp. YIM B06452 TaxID=3082158 RepID=UPI0031FE8F6A